MRAAAIQIHSLPGGVADNLKKGVAMYRKAAKEGAHLVVFPELWTCGYYLETEGFSAAAKENERILELFCDMAREYGIVTLLPLPQLKDGRLYIGSYLIEADGRILYEYRKSFLWGREQKFFVHGKREYHAISTSIGKLGILICYDIEFPEPSRVLALDGAEIILVPSVWSIPAENRWRIQLPSRALDNTVFVIGVNNVGEGACGACMMISPMGDVLAEASGTEEEVLICNLDLSLIGQVREKIPYLKEYDLNLYPGGYQGYTDGSF